MKKKTHEEYVEELKIKNPNLEVIEEYVSASTPIKHKCLTHGTIWEISPSNALKGKGCKECGIDKNKKKFTKSNEQYVKDISLANPDIIPMENYVGVNVPILHKCTRHNYLWKPFPSNVLKGEGCPECGIEKNHLKQMKSHEQYVKELAKVNSNIEVVQQYINAKTPIMHHCLKHDKYWEISPSGALSGRECPECWKEKLRNTNTLTNEEYIRKVNEINPNIMVTDKYIDAKTPITHYCIKHDIYWEALPTNILKGCGCSECGKEKISEKLSLTNEQYLEKLKTNNSNIISLEKYIDMKTPILHKCLIHNVDFFTTPDSALQGCGCYKCKSEKISSKTRKTHDQYIKEIFEKDSNIEVIDNYIDSHTPIRHKCKKCEYEWLSSPSNVLNGNGCPRCNSSKGEYNISKIFDFYKIKYETQKKFKKCKDINFLSFDFYLPDYNIAIEYQGKQHYEPVEYFGGDKKFKIQQLHDKIKKEYCEKNDIHLLCIPYTEFDDIEQILLNYLKLYGFKK